ncbi:hypothetical protein DH2020_038971 [Rehmannia glutinosa]|uniref:DYW domain-containing protein n=1 Tax=Rehmannia glutinosa TaxID=99300 RepID=A0ABR0UYA4_REHGL
MSSVHFFPATTVPSISTAKITPFKNLESCSTMAELKQNHAQIIKLGLCSDNDAMGRVIKFCSLAKSGDLNYALKVFDLLPHPDAFIYNTMFRGYLQAQLYRNCIILYAHMLEHSVTPNKFSFPPVIRACCFDGAVEEAKQVHAHVIKLGFVQDSYCQNNLIHMYVNFDSLEEAKRVFDSLDKKDDVSWTTLISGFSRLGCVDEAFTVFESMPVKNSAAWNAVIAAHVQNNRFHDAFKLFDEMRKENVAIDNFVAASMLAACTGLGALSKVSGFTSISEVVGLPLITNWQRQLSICIVNVDVWIRPMRFTALLPGMEHYGCLVDLLGRAGLLEEAKKVINDMPMRADVGVLGALLGACRIYGNIDMAEEIGKQVIELEPNNSGRYVLLANLYAKAGRYEDVAYIRKLMNDRGVKKVAGFSMIELEGASETSSLRGRAHPEAKEIYAKVEEMLVRIKDRGYVPSIDGMLYDIREEENDNPLQYHSEKLAIAFGLLKTKRGETIRVTKNLRVCKDCHQSSKPISLDL